MIQISTPLILRPCANEKKRQKDRRYNFFHINKIMI
jgi:hypothetical protein